MTRREVLTGAAGVSAWGATRIDEAVRTIESQIASGQVEAATLYLRDGSGVFRKSFGRASDPDAVFLLASITKPMTATAVMVLADRGNLSLSDRVQRFIPEFRGDGRERVLVRHLLTHTSGLPDMLPENVELRKRHAPLSDFVAGTCRTPLLFEPGSEVRYQSMGILLAAEVASRIAGKPFPTLLQEHVFRPLRMTRTSLGMGGRAIADTMRCQVDEPSDWDWNSTYWRNLGAPWGGAHASAGDVARFLEHFGEVVKPATAAAMATNQTAGMKQSYGLGWRLNDAAYGRGSSTGTYGHGGSTGTLCWHDPKRDRTFVLLSTKPAEHSNKTLLHPVSDLVSI